jgi:hypothetical protein
MLNIVQKCQIIHKKMLNVKQYKIVFESVILYPHEMYNLNRLIELFFVNLNKIKQALIAHVAQKRRN